MLPFVGVALKAQEKMEICDKKGQGIIMRFCRLYPPEKIGRIIEVAQSYIWWRKNPVAAFMKGVGDVNKNEKDKFGAKAIEAV